MKATILGVACYLLLHREPTKGTIFSLIEEEKNLVGESKKRRDFYSYDRITEADLREEE